MRKKSVCHGIVYLFVLIVIASAGCNGNASDDPNEEKKEKTVVSADVDPLEMLKTVELLDKQDLVDELDVVASCLEKENFSCAKKHLQGAEAYVTDDTDVQQLENAQNSYRKAQAEYTARKKQEEEERRIARERARQRQLERQRAQSYYSDASSSSRSCRNPEIINGTVFCDNPRGGLPSALGTVYRSGNRWAYTCIHGRTDYSYSRTAHGAMRKAVDNCTL